MNNKFWSRSFESSLSSNPKSKIQNRKLAGIVAFVGTLAVGGAVGSGAAAEQSRPHRIPRCFPPFRDRGAHRGIPSGTA
jgi:hypothetical protein